MSDTKRVLKNQREARHLPDIKDVGDNLEEEETEGRNTKGEVGDVPLELQHLERQKETKKLVVERNTSDQSALHFNPTTASR